MQMRRSTNSLLEYARSDPESTSDKNWAGGIKTGGSKLKILDRRALLESTKESRGDSRPLPSSKGSFRRTASGSTLNITGSFRRSANNLNSLTKRVGSSKEDLRIQREFVDILKPSGSRNAEFTLNPSQKISSLSKGLLGSFNGSFRSIPKKEKVIDSEEDNDVLDWDEDGEEFDFPLNTKAAKDRIIALACRELELAFD
jgi:hypothetical protein